MSGGQRGGACCCDGELCVRGKLQLCSCLEPDPENPSDPIYYCICPPCDPSDPDCDWEEKGWVNPCQWEVHLLNGLCYELTCDGDCDPKDKEWPGSLPFPEGCQPCCDEVEPPGGDECLWDECCPELPKNAITFSINVEASYIELSGCACGSQGNCLDNEDTQLECFGSRTFEWQFCDPATDPGGCAGAITPDCSFGRYLTHVMCAGNDQCPGAGALPTAPGNGGTIGTAPSVSIPNCSVIDQTCCDRGWFLTDYIDYNAAGGTAPAPYRLSMLQCPNAYPRGCSGYGVKHTGISFSESVTIPCDEETGEYRIEGTLRVPELEFGHRCNIGVPNIGNCPDPTCSFGGTTFSLLESYSCGNTGGTVAIQGVWTAVISFNGDSCSVGEVSGGVTFTPNYEQANPEHNGLDSISWGFPPIPGSHPCNSGSATGKFNWAQSIADAASTTYGEAVQYLQSCGPGAPSSALSPILSTGISGVLDGNVSSSNSTGKTLALKIGPWKTAVVDCCNVWGPSAFTGPTESKGFSGCIPYAPIPGPPITGCPNCGGNQPIPINPPGGITPGAYVYQSGCTPKKGEVNNTITFSWQERLVTIVCKHQSSDYKCSLGLFGGTPSAHECATCSKFQPKDQKHPENDDFNKNKASRGVGDTIAKVTSAVGIKPCGGCKKRQQMLNKAFPYKGHGPEPECPTCGEKGNK